jgi:hypothetical protein
MDMKNMGTSVSTGDANAKQMPNEGLELLRLFRNRIGGSADAFLFNPADDVGGNIYDGNLSGFGGTEKTHGVTVYKRHVGKVQRDILFWRFSGKDGLFQFGDVFARELTAQLHFDGIVGFPDCGDFQHVDLLRSVTVHVATHMDYRSPRN